MSFLLAGFFSLATEASLKLGLSAPFTRVLSYLGSVNLVLAVFNLLPAFPLDGGRVLRAWLWQRTGNVVKATEIASKLGQILAYILIGIGSLVLFWGALIPGLWQILIGVFLMTAAKNQLRAGGENLVFSNVTVADAMSSAPVVATPDTSLSHVIDKIVLRQGYSFLPVVENGVLLCKIGSMVLRSIGREHWSSTKVDDVFVDLTKETFIAPDMKITDLLKLIGTLHQRKFLVARGHRLVGVISLTDLTRFVALAPLFTQKSQLENL